jgi:ribosomal protein S18 acetylase RimI-like enzyme
MPPHVDLKGVAIKEAVLRDFRPLIALIQSYYSSERIPFNRAAILSGLKLLLNNPTLGQAWLILNRNRSIGYIVATFGFDLEFGGRQATITDFYIKTPHRGNGVGRKVLIRVEDFCRMSGVEAVELQVTRSNARALAFYEGVGFAAHDRIPMSKRIL